MDIEQGIGQDSGPQYRPGKLIYPWDKMEVGDSVLVDGLDASASGCRARNSAKEYQRRHGPKTGIKFSARKVSEGKVRIWRVA